MDLRLMLEETVKRYARKTAIILREREISYIELDEASNKVANTLTTMGISKGERVAMIVSNSPEFVITFFGIIKAGAIAVPLDTKYKVCELAFLFNSCKPKVIITESPVLEQLIPTLSRFDFIERIIDLGSGYEGKFISYQEIMATGSAQKLEVPLAPDDIALISYTGGPTNRPRGAAFAHRTLVTAVGIYGDGFQQTDKDIVVLFALPMYHMFSLASVLLASLNKGSTVVMIPGTGISTGSLIEAIERERSTILVAVPYIYALLVNIAEREGIKNDLSSLHLCISGGAPLSVDIVQQFKQYYGCTIADVWGLTEAVSHVTCPPMDGTGKLGSVGRALPGWEIKMIDDKGNELPPNQSGEIIVSGQIMEGYHNNSQATAEVIKDGWLYTGDIGMVDDDGHLFLSGRKKDMIIFKGQNIYPSDVEEVLHTHPDIAQARVTGIPDKLRGEIVRAIISLKVRGKVNEQQIRQFCQEHMADYKVPRQIMFTSNLPRRLYHTTLKVASGVKL